MLDRRDSRNFLDAFEKAMATFAVTEDEIFCVDTQEDGEMVNALIMVRGKGLTMTVVTMFHKLIDKLERARIKKEKK